MLARRLLPLAAVLGAVAAAAPAAHASLILTRNAGNPTMAVQTRNGVQVAEVSYTQNGVVKHTLVWGAVNARTPSRSVQQVAFHVDYSGGYGSFRNARLWATIKAHNQCKPDPAVKAELHWVVYACTMTTDGSHWALQRWQRLLPDGGQKPGTANASAWELHISHWTGAPTVLWLKWDWAYVGASIGPVDHTYGEVSFHDHAVYGFTHTLAGAPTDTYGRNVVVDVHDPAHWHTGYRQISGWYRWNSFLSEGPLGDFCAGVFPRQFGRTVAPDGDMYRATITGPGVAPDAFWQGPPPGGYQPGGFPSNDYLLGPTMLPEPLRRAIYTRHDDQLLNAEQVLIASAAPTTSPSYEKCGTPH